jgi:hypothetical protein
MYRKSKVDQRTWKAGTIDLVRSTLRGSPGLWRDDGGGSLCLPWGRASGSADGVNDVAAFYDGGVEALARTTPSWSSAPSECSTPTPWMGRSGRRTSQEGLHASPLTDAGGRVRRRHQKPQGKKRGVARVWGRRGARHDACVRGHLSCAVWKRTRSNPKPHLSARAL